MLNGDNSPCLPCRDAREHRSRLSTQHGLRRVELRTHGFSEHTVRELIIHYSYLTLYHTLPHVSFLQ
jgi:hypothetical protein